MKDMLTKITAWIKANVLLFIGLAIVLVFVLFPKVRRKLFGTVRHHRKKPVVQYVTKSKRALPRSVGTTKKKPWQIKGSLAAKRHMAELRRKR